MIHCNQLYFFFHRSQITVKLKTTIEFTIMKAFSRAGWWVLVVIDSGIQGRETARQRD